MDFINNWSLLLNYRAFDAAEKSRIKSKAIPFKNGCYTKKRRLHNNMHEVNKSGIML